MGRPYRVLVVVSAAVFMASLDLFIVNIAFPDIQADFGGTSLSTLSWVLNAYAIVFAALLVPAGRLADLVGRRRLFLIGLGVFVAASALCAAAPSVETLIAARILQAAGGAMLIPTSLGLLLPEFPPERRASAVGAWAAMGAVAAAAGPPIGGLLVEASWRWVFLVNLPVGIGVALAAVRVLRETRDPDRGSVPDLLGAALLVAGIGALTFAIVEGPDLGWGSAEIVALFTGAVVLVALFVARSARHPAPVLELPMLRVRSFAVANVGAFVFFAVFAGMLLGGVLWLTGPWGYSVLKAGLALSPGPLMAATFALPAGRLADRFGQRAVGAPGALLFAASFAWLAWRVGPEPAYASEYLPGMIAGGIGVGLTIPTLSSAAAASLPAARFATGSAVLAMSRQIGSAVGVALLVAVLDDPAPAEALGAFQRAWLLMGVAALGTVAAFLAMGRVRVLDERVVAPVAVAEGEPERRARVSGRSDPFGAGLGSARLELGRPKASTGPSAPVPSP
jgi:EmrB/QacA subfamily drug resistance transporter